MAPKKRTPESLRPKFFGIHDTFAQAFPTIASGGGVVKINGRGARNIILGDERRFDVTLTEFIDCLDPQCDGAFQISAVLLTMVKNQELHKEDWKMCTGGSNLSPCQTQFNYNIDIVLQGDS